MSQFIMVGCDLHDRSMLIRYAVDMGEPLQASFVNDTEGRRKMIRLIQDLQGKHPESRAVLVYEASGQGYGLCDLLHDQKIGCFVLSPTHLPRSAKSAKQKTDANDAQGLLEVLRGHLLAGNKLPVVWTPPQRLRDDRELVRARIDVAEELTRVKLQLLSLLKRRGVAKPGFFTTKWTKRVIRWLREEIVAKLDPTVAQVVESLVARHELYQAEQLRLDRAIRELSQTTRYQAAHAALRKIPGVGLLSAMTFLTEMGDLTRFQNRREVAAYLGLCPASYESGESSDRKGRITRQGPSRLRKMLCQAAWVGVIHCAETAVTYERLKRGQKNRTKKAVVALMRQLAIRMWHRALECGVDHALMGRGGPHGKECAVAVAT